MCHNEINYAIPFGGILNKSFNTELRLYISVACCICRLVIKCNVSACQAFQLK